jgi:hypothetical protein
VEDTNEILECGCERSFIGGKYFLIPCDEHDEESHPPDVIPVFTKFRKYLHE